MKPPGEALRTATATGVGGVVTVGAWIGVFSILAAYPGEETPPWPMFVLFLLLFFVGSIGAALTLSGLSQTVRLLRIRRRE